MIARLLERWTTPFRAADPTLRAAYHGLALACAVYLALYGLYSQWYIEDAAIVFAYARNAANGLGFVPWVGGERVEGFSDPLWTLGLTVLSYFWVSPWIAVKVSGAVFGVATLVGVFRLSREVMADGADPRWAAAAAALVALSPQFAAWNAAGLENPLFGWLITFGALAVVQHRPPWRAGVWWGLVAITRPEGLIYGAVAGTVGTLRAGRGAPLWGAGFALGVAIPLVGWLAPKFAYFAWPLPNTYYAKLGERLPQPFGWTAPGWTYLRYWALRTGQGFLLPLYVFGLSGVQTGWRRWVAGGYLGLLAILLLPGLKWTTEIPGWPLTDPAGWGSARTAWLAVGAFGLPLMVLGQPRWPARLLVAWLTAAGMFFAVYSGGDWMVGFRWLAVPAIGLGILLADSVRMWWPRLGVRASALVSIGVAGVVAGAGGAEVVRYVRSADTSPFDVHDRVSFHERVARKLSLDLPPRVADTDMGAHMWWYQSPVVDYAALVDVALAQHHWAPGFLDEYVYGELRPEIVHVHGAWISKSRLRSRPGFSRYVAITGYNQSSRVVHEGSFVPRELLLGVWNGPDGRTARFTGPRGEAELVGWEAPSVVAAGEPLPLRTAWRAKSGTRPFLVVAFLADASGVRASWEMPPAWGWLNADKWRSGEVVVTRHLAEVPGDLPAGRYDLGFWVSGRPGPAWPATAAEPTPRFARGEVAFAGAIEVGPREAVAAAAVAHFAASERLAAAGDCEAAAAARAAGRDLFRDEPDRVAGLRVPIGRCFLARGDPVSVSLAVRWAPADPQVRAGGVARADQWEAEGAAALAAGDLEAAHLAWTAALGADPLRSWLRRTLERLRHERLGLGEEDEPTAPVEPDPAEAGVRGG